MSKRKTITALVVLLLALTPLAADNQVVSSSGVTSFLESRESSRDVDWQSYSSQLGMVERELIDLDYLQEMRILSARGEANYPVTVGDIYTLTYTYSNELITLVLEVGHDGQITVPSIASFSTVDKTFTALKSEIESAVRTRYPYSNPSLTMTSLGAFSVRISGYVTSSQYIDCWGLSRLSDLAYYATGSASTRDVTVVSADGTEKHYDLYAARMLGDASQDPYLKAGDSITFNRRGTAVLVNGSVMRSGTYQLLASETLSSLINDYAQGLDRQADVDRISVARYESGTWREYTVALDEDFVLLDGDSVYVYAAGLPIGSVTVSGALQSTDTAGLSNTIAGQVSAQYFYRFTVGETVEDMLVDMSQFFISSSDLDGCSLTRDGKTYAISFRDVLYGNDPAGDMLLQNGDRFTVPFSNQVVTVNGAVNNPGTYAYAPGKDINYYVNLAGGLSSSARGINHYRLYNSYGDRLDDSTPITAETTIEIERSTFERDLGITVTVVGLVSSVIGIVASIINMTT